MRTKKILWSHFILILCFLASCIQAPLPSSTQPNISNSNGFKVQSTSSKNYADCFEGKEFTHVKYEGSINRNYVPGCQGCSDSRNDLEGSYSDPKRYPDPSGSTYHEATADIQYKNGTLTISNLDWQKYFHSRYFDAAYYRYRYTAGIRRIDTHELFYSEPLEIKGPIEKGKTYTVRKSTTVRKGRREFTEIGRGKNSTTESEYNAHVEGHHIYDDVEIDINVTMVDGNISINITPPDNAQLQRSGPSTVRISYAFSVEVPEIELTPSTNSFDPAIGESVGITVQNICNVPGELTLTGQVMDANGAAGEQCTRKYYPEDGDTIQWDGTCQTSTGELGTGILTWTAFIKDFKKEQTVTVEASPSRSVPPKGGDGSGGENPGGGDNEDGSDNGDSDGENPDGENPDEGNTDEENPDEDEEDENNEYSIVLQDGEWFSTNPDSTKKSLSYRINDKNGTNKPWVLEFKRKSEVVHTEQGIGSQSRVWNGQGSGNQEGRYTMVLKLEDKPQNGKKRQDSERIGIDNTPPELSDIILSEDFGGKASIKVNAVDPKSNGVRSGLDGDSFVFSYTSPDDKAGPIQIAHNNPNKATLSADLFGFGAASATPQTSTARVKDRAGNLSADPFAGDTEFCLDNPTRRRVLGQYRKLVRELEATLKNYSRPPDATESDNIRIQGLVQCEPGECIKDYSDRLAAHDWGLEARERQEFNILRAQAKHHRDVAVAYIEAVAKTVVTGGLLLAPLPAVAEFGAVHLAYEIEAFTQLYGSQTPRLWAYFLNNADAYSDTYFALKTYLAYSRGVTAKLAEESAQKVATCLKLPAGGKKPLEAVDSINTSVVKVSSAAKTIKLYSSKLITRKKNGELLIPKNKPAHIYHKVPKQGTDNISRDIEVGLIESRVRPPNPHEINTADYFMQAGHHVRLDAGSKGVPDLMLKPYERVIPWETPNDKLVFWDLKRVGKLNPKDPSNTVKRKIEESTKDVIGFFRSRRLPHRTIIDVRNLGVDAEIATKAIHRMLNSDYKGTKYRDILSEIVVLSDDTVYYWSIFSQPAALKGLNFSKNVRIGSPPF